MDYWEGIRDTFKKEEDDFIHNKIRLDKYRSDGTECVCWACSYPIHNEGKFRLLNRKKVHPSCFKKMKRLDKQKRGLYGIRS